MRTASKGRSKLAGLRVLVAEDSFHIALVIETALEAEGAAIIGPATSLDTACQLARTEEPDLAIVDLKLQDQESLPLIRQLEDAGVKVVVATGYDLTAKLDRELSGLPVLKKPYTPEQLVDLVCGIL
jgi:DNA-binding response OmpR family regulator